MDSNSTNTTLGNVIACEEPTEAAVHVYETFSWLFENVLQTGVGLAGIMANTLAIPILCSKEMSSIFNRLLVLLAIYDNFYILCSLLEALRKNSPHNDLHEHAFAYGLYQLHNFVLCGSIFLTVGLALERYRAVWRPIEYHNQCVGVNPWRRVIVSYLLPVVVLSSLHTIPKFFEVEMLVQTADVMKAAIFNSTDNLTYDQSVPVNLSMAAPTELRLDDTYVVLYVNLARLLVQGVIPFIGLSFLNYRIYWVIRRRSALQNRPQIQNCGNGVASQQKKDAEAKQSLVLFVIVLLYFLCHTPRFILNIHEFITLETLKHSIESGCNSVSLWALGGASISHFLMTLNSSVNFFIYASTSSMFRDILRGHIQRITPQPILNWISRRKLKKKSDEQLTPEPEQLHTPKPGGHAKTLMVENDSNGKTDVEMHLIQTTSTKPAKDQVAGNGSQA